MKQTRLGGLILAIVLVVVRASFRSQTWQHARPNHRWQEPPVVNVGDSEAAQAQFEQGSAALQRNDADAAIKSFNHAIRLNPRYADAYFARGLAYDRKLDYDRAIKDYTEGLALDPENADGYCNRGIAHSDKANYEEAIKDFSEAIRRKPGESDYYVQRGHAYADMKDLRRALADFEEAIQINPEGSDGYTARGYVHQKKKEFEQAIEDYSQAIRLNSQDLAAYNSLAWVLATCPRAELRDGKLALEYALYICKTNGWKEGNYMDTLAAAYARLGRFDEAVRWETRALERPEGVGDKAETRKAHQRLVRYENHQAYTDG
jgi:tetratricopeptide (TPR) repeat protein